MADPRAATTNRIGTEPRRPLTFKIDNSDITYSATAAGGSAVVGRAVMLSAAGTVRLTGAGTHVLGKLLQVEADNYCTVECGSVVTLPKGDNAIAVGDRVVGDTLSAERGYIRGSVEPTGSYVEGTAEDSGRGRHTVLDAGTATAIEVMLG